MRFIIIIITLLLAPSLAEARAPKELIAIKAGEPVTIRPDRAYILFRTIRPEDVHSFEPVFLRIPIPEELERYDQARRAAFAKAEPEMIRRRERQIERNREREAQGEAPEPVEPVPSLETFNFIYGDVANVNRVDAAHALVKGRPESLYFVEALPGDYVLYGVSWEFGPPAIATCMCFGTVGFAAPAGTVTDLGYFFADTVHRLSKIPELQPESDFGLTMKDPAFLIGATVRPARADSSMPDALRGANVRPAEYRAVGRFLERRTGSVNRLVPVPGVLDYNEGRVIDVKTGKAVPDVN